MVVVATTVVDVVGVVGVVAVVVVVVELVVDVVAVLEVVVVLGGVVEVVVDLKCPNALPFPATAVTAVVRMRPTIRTAWCLTSVVSSRRLGAVFNMCAGHPGAAE